MHPWVVSVGRLTMRAGARSGPTRRSSRNSRRGRGPPHGGRRRLGRKDATAAGAAGATVALLGAAAVVRRARKRAGVSRGGRLVGGSNRDTYGAWSKTPFRGCQCRTARWAPWRTPTTTRASRPRRPIRLLEIRGHPAEPGRGLPGRRDDAAGGTALFVGTVRNHDGGADVDALGYSCIPRPRRRCDRVAEKVVADYPVRALAAVHRVGDLAVGDLAVVVAVSLPATAGEGVRKPAATDRRPQARSPDLEAPESSRTVRRSGWGLLTPER